MARQLIDLRHDRQGHGGRNQNLALLADHRGVHRAGQAVVGDIDRRGYVKRLTFHRHRLMLVGQNRHQTLDHQNRNNQRDQGAAMRHQHDYSS